MCITSGPANLSDTKIMSIKLDEEYHLIAYSNSVENYSKHTNSMILAVPGTLTQTDFYDTTLYAKFLEEIEEFRKPRTKSISRSIDPESDDLSFENFQIGMYNIFLSNSAELIDKAIGELPEDKRPIISTELLDFFKNHYAGWSFVVCVFDNAKKIDAQPIMFKYKPFDKDMLFFPGMDSHDGNAPNLEAKVRVDHYLISELKGVGEMEFSSQTLVPDILQNLELYGVHEQTIKQNGDWYLKIEDNVLNSIISQLVRSSEIKIKNPIYHNED